MDYVLPDEREKESQLGLVVLLVLDQGHTGNQQDYGDNGHRNPDGAIHRRELVDVRPGWVRNVKESPRAARENVIRGGKDKWRTVA